MPFETVALRTSDGLALQADVARPAPGAVPAGAAVLTHPHPRYGGDRANPVVEAMFRALAAAGVVTVRFDFRGVGASEGRHDGGRGEALDVVAALDLAAAAVPGRPVVLGGYSFGAAVALGVVDERVAGWCAVAPPLTMAPGSPAAARDPRPVHLVVPTHDQFSPPEDVRRLAGDWLATTVDEVPMADHFLAGATGVVAEIVVAFTLRLAAA